MKKSLFLKAAFTAMLLTFTLGFSSCSSDDDDNDDKGPKVSAGVIELNEALIKANAYVAANESLTGLKESAEQVEKLLSSSGAKESEISAALASINVLLDSAKSTTTLKESAFAGIAGPSNRRTYKGLFNPTILKSDYDSIWLKYITPRIGSEKSEETAKKLKSSISAPTYGKNLSKCHFQKILMKNYRKK